MLCQGAHRVLRGIGRQAGEDKSRGQPWGCARAWGWAGGESWKEGREAEGGTGQRELRQLASPWYTQ